MRILITGGGTAGHVTPLLAVASSLKKRSSDFKIYYIYQYKDKSSKDFKNNSLIDVSAGIFAGKFRRFYKKKWYWYLTQPVLLLKNIRDAVLFAIGFLQSLILLIFWNPDVIFVKGGYVGLPVGLAAGLLKKPLVTHDSDIVPGLTNRILARFAKLQAVGMPIKAYDYNKTKLRYTGVPIRQDFVSYNPSNQLDNQLFSHQNKPVIAIVGGSLGAIRLNNAIMNNLEYIMAHCDANIYWLTGRKQYKNIRKWLQQIDSKNNGRVVAVPYSNELHIILSSATIVVTRAGATTLAELAVLKKPIILVPNPYLTAGHQLKNAQFYKENNAAIVLYEEEITNNNTLGDQILELLHNTDKQQELKNNISKYAITNSAEKIVDVLIEAQKKN